ncbi:MAG TPA: hypothetical protein VGR73_13435 [Bryobacteraceae bacterium]|nr:hypothetical protein [Bryobacteraceae bacterium]
MKALATSFLLLLLNAATASANVALLLEEPFGAFGGMNPTGHAAVYLSDVCADSLVSLRRCHHGEQGVVISRYHRVGRYDWIAIPVMAYLYGVDRAALAPREASAQEVAALRDDYRRKHLEEVAPDEADGGAPQGDWTQLIGAAYDRTIYAFELKTAADQDDRFIRDFNSRSNENRFNLLFQNCADFARQVIDFYYPKAVRRSLIADVGIMTPKQAAKRLVRYGKKHPELQFSGFVIPQVTGTVPRSTAVRGVIESLLKSKKYIVPLAPLAVLHPFIGGSLAVAWVEDGRFNPRRFANAGESAVEPESIAQELQSNRIVALAPGRRESPTASR